MNSRHGFWGKGAIETISEQLRRELPGLRGYSPSNMKNMRLFYEKWSVLDSKGDDQKAFCSSPSGLLYPRGLASAAPIRGISHLRCGPFGTFSHPH